MINRNTSLQKNFNDNLKIGAQGGAIAFILRIASTILGFSNQVVLARILGAGSLGEVIIAITVLRISAQIAKFGMEEAMMKFIPLYTDQKDHPRLKGSIFFAIKFCLLSSTFFMLIVFLFSKSIALDIFQSENLVKLIPVIIFALPAWVTRDVIGGILKGYKEPFVALIPEAIISPLSRLIIFLLLTLKSISPFYAIISFVCGEILSFIVSIFFLRKRIADIKHVKKFYDNKKVLEVAYAIIFTSMSVLLYTQADIWILGMLTSPENVAVYGIASKIALLVYFPMMAFSSVVPSVISSVYASGNQDELRKVVRQSTRWILSTAMPIILLLILEGKNILNIFYGSEFVAGYIILIILVSGQLIKASAGLIGILLQMTGSHKIYMKITIFWGGLNILMNILLIPRYGSIGAAAATAFCMSMVDIMCIFIIYRRLSILTLAEGLYFDILFIIFVTATYFTLIYYNLDSGFHVLFILALTGYLWKSIVNNDIPWRMLLPKFSKKNTVK